MKSEEKLLVEVCCGTSCYILGGKELLNWVEAEMNTFADRVDFRAVPCLNACETDHLGEAPFVRINGVISGGMTIRKLSVAIQAALEGAKAK